MIIDAYRALQAAESFWAFRQYINPDLKCDWWPRDIARELQQFWEDYQAGLRPKLVIMAPPQHGKSTAIIDFIAWLFGKRYSIKTIYASFSDRLGVRANLKLQRIINSNRYTRVFPDTKLIGQKTQDYFEFDGGEGFFRNTTVRGSVTGESLDIGVIDDPIKGRLEANSVTVRNAAWDWLTDDFSTRFADDGALLIILTRWHIDDPVGRLLAIDPDVRVLRHQAIAEQDESNRKVGEPLFPDHKSLEFLLGIKARMLPTSWNSLYQQSPTLAEGNIFKPDKIEIIDAIPSGAKFCRAWDLAATKDGGDATAGGLLSRHGDRYIICDMITMHEGPEDVEGAILNTAARDGKTCYIRIPQDPGQAGKAQAKRFAAKLAGWPVVFVQPRGSKAHRADGFAAQVNIGNVAMIRASWNAALIDRMRSFTGASGEKDDEIDALSDAFDQLTQPTYNGPSGLQIPSL